MELNITRQTVSSNHVCINTNLEHNVDFDVQMPDYCAGVQRVLRCEAKPYVTSKSVNGKNISIEGNINFCVLYLDDCGKMHTFRQSVPFMKSFESDDNLESCTLSVSSKCAYINQRAVSSHKLEVHCVVAMCIKGVCQKRTEIICDIDDDGIFFNRSNCKATVPINFSEKNIVFEEELQIGAAQPSICDIVRYEVCPVITGHKIVNGKVVVKGELSVDVLYCTEDHIKAEKFSSTIPFSQIIEIDRLTDDCVCDITAEMLSVDIKPRSSYDGDSKSFILNAKMCINVNAVCNNEIPIISDAYSPKYHVDINFENVSTSNVINSAKENFLCKKTFEFSDGELNEVLDIWCSANVLGHRIEGKTLIITGTVFVNLIGKNSEGVINFLERPIDFEYRYDCDELNSKAFCEPQVGVISCRHSFSGSNSLDVAAELLFTFSIYEINNLSAVTEISVNDTACESKNEFSMVIYFAENGESVWDIAKEYKASPEEIMKINLVDSVLTESKALVIPC